MSEDFYENKTSKSDESGLPLHEEFDSGLVDDVFGQGSWHLEMMDDESASLVAEHNDKLHQFRIYAEEGELRIEKYG